MAAVSVGYDHSTPPRVQISITGECNLNCFFCEPLGHNRAKTGVKWALLPSDAARFTRMVAEKGVDSIEIAGCEPLLRKDASSFVKVIAGCKNVRELSLRTNGTFLKNHADSLRKAGLKRLEVSVSSLNFMKYQKITGRDNLYRVLDGLEKAERLKFGDLILNILVMSGINTDELIDFAMMTKTRDLHVRFIEYHPIDREKNSLPDRLNLSILHIKRAIDGFQKLFPIDDTFESPNGHARFKFIDGRGTVSFVNQADIIKKRSIPTIWLNSLGDLSVSTNPGKVYNVLKDLRKDSSEQAVSKLLDRICFSQAAKKKAKQHAVHRAKAVSKTRRVQARA